MRSLSRFLHSFHLCHLSHPIHDRVLFHYLSRWQGNRILELGVENLVPALRLIRLAGLFHDPGSVRYTGIDLFEARPSAAFPGLTLKAAYQQLRRSGAVIRLVPGDVFTALRRSANEIGPVDLVIIRQGVQEQSLARAWFYLPRLLHACTGVFQEVPGEDHKRQAMRQISRDETISLASAYGRRSAA